ncbi:hypothetical protein SAMN06295905_2852 [Devosia lucknowensis]|uniref:Uncharacterized protein n=1 Tax=Devosia lucknowensis TaxID=1096929 RepID=A0A1Y6G5Z9_9HYPH|nr:hypothetical protein [Devosia lucknowensis]SMQ85565.1 hypothetical protein SAMN06295905_2852 [Devosia lucknowensis]
MNKDQKPGNRGQDDDTKSLVEAREEAEQPAGEFETAHDQQHPKPKPEDDQPE